MPDVVGKHPRLRGEDQDGAYRPGYKSETPPLTRGRRTLFESSIRSLGNTPAYAGKTTSVSLRTLFERKHPRLRGEDHTRAHLRRERLETPPLTRGRPKCSYQDLEHPGKHPRLRGEDQADDVERLPQLETPPLTWGRPWPILRRSACCGNTPAYAGKTSMKRSLAGLPRKHPRLRGEDANVRFGPNTELETPPLTRGRPNRLKAKMQISGNTPAYAGKTCRRPSRRAPSWKHPRLRGEDRGGRLERRNDDGNTPAYAGKTPRQRCRSRRPRKHPRLRGEDSNILCKNIR